MKICVAGAGAIGGWVAAKLAIAGNDVSLIARGATLAAIASDGLNLSETGEERAASVRATDDADALGAQDVMVIAVKAPALAEAALAVRPLLTPRTLVVPMLNGVPWWFVPGQRLRSVDPEGHIAAALPLDQVIGCVVHASCRRLEANRVEVVHSEKLILGEPAGGRSDRCVRLCSLFEHSGIRCEQSADVRRAIWYKLWGNATINPLSALTRSTADTLLGDRELRAFMAEAMDELACVGAKIDCPIEESAEDRMAVTARLGAFKSSMLQDVEAGRPIELEALLGAPREIARRVEIPTPRLDLLYAMTRRLAENLGLA